MFMNLSPMFIPLAVFCGGIFAPVLGWARAYLDSKKEQGANSEIKVEGFDARRLLASGIIAVIAAMIFMGQYAAAISVGLPDLELAFIAGFGADKIIKNAIGI